MLVPSPDSWYRTGGNFDLKFQEIPLSFLVGALVRIYVHKYEIGTKK